MADPRPDSVEAVVFLVGDAGGADGVGNPVLEKLTWEVEHWSQSLARESAVTVIFLGDNVYPSGYHDVSDDDHPRDSVRLGNQLAVVSGPQAKTYGTRGIFIPGNHGWANTSGAVAMSRLDNLQARIDRERVRGPEVHVMPAAGLTGPEYVDLGERISALRLITAVALRTTAVWSERRYLDLTLLEPKEVAKAASPKHRGASSLFYTQLGT